MQQVAVIVAEPKTPGNVGAIARCMMNFNVHQLILVNPCLFTDETYSRALHAKPLLDNATIVSTFEEACDLCDYVAGTSSIIHHEQKKHLRTPVLLSEFAQRTMEVQGTIGIAFGREDYGLYNEEIAHCDILVHIPTNPEYLSLNLSHAVAVVLYQLYITQNPAPFEKRVIGSQEKQQFYQVFSSILDGIHYPEHKRENTEMLFQRLMGRAIPSTWEYHTLMGVFTKIVSLLQKKND